MIGERNDLRSNFYFITVAIQFLKGPYIRHTCGEAVYKKSLLFANRGIVICSYFFIYPTPILRFHRKKITVAGCHNNNLPKIKSALWGAQLIAPITKLK